MTEDETEQTTQEVVTTLVDVIIMYGNRGHYFGFEHVVPNRIDCVDGFSVSILAGGGTYCSPRPPLCMCWMPDHPSSLKNLKADGLMHNVDCDYRGPFSAVEVGFPNQRPEPWGAWDEYCDDPGGDPTECVYPFVPADLVRDLIISHGGEVAKPDTYYRGQEDPPGSGAT